MSDLHTTEVTFVSKSGGVVIRMTNTMANTIDSAAKSLGARYVVMEHGWNYRAQRAIWGVYDMRKLQKNNPVPGVVSLPLPARTFDTVKADGAVMWAIAMLMRD